MEVVPKWLSVASLLLGWFYLVRPERLSSVEVVTSERLSDLMSGEWMVEFYAPWCPACKQFADTWERFGEWAEDEPTALRVAKVDVTVETMLSGQFMVTHLPSIYHIRDGEVRVYQSARSYSDLVEYIEGRLWERVEPVPWWRSPTASHMRVIGVVFWLSEKAKELQTTLEKDYELPTYAVFIVIAVATIVVGLTLGGLTVCCIELCMRMCSRDKPHPQQRAPPTPQSQQPTESDESAKQDDVAEEVTTPTKPDASGPDTVTTPTKPDASGPDTVTTPTKPDASGPDTVTTPTKPDTSGSGTRHRKKKSKKNAEQAEK